MHRRSIQAKSSLEEGPGEGEISIKIPGPPNPGVSFYDDSNPNVDTEIAKTEVWGLYSAQRLHAEGGHCIAAKLAHPLMPIRMFWRRDRRGSPPENNSVMDQR
jgi:hypothetical protein